MVFQIGSGKCHEVEFNEQGFVFIVDIPKVSHCSYMISLKWILMKDKEKHYVRDKIKIGRKWFAVKYTVLTQGNVMI